VAGVKQSLGVDLAGVRFPLPVLAAAGCFGVGREFTALADLHRLGGVVSRSLTYGPAKGSPTPRVAESPSGILTSVGHQNPGVEEFVREDLPRLERIGLPVVASVAGATLEEYVRVTSALQGRPGIVALEVYLSCADEEHGGAPFYKRIDRISEVVGAVARLSRLPVFAKLPALVPDLVEAARTCVRVGAHGLTLIDSVPGMAVDVRKLRPKLATAIGGLSGPAIRPIAVGSVFRVAQAMPEVPIMGVGGIASGEDAVEFLLAGAWAVQVGTAMLVDPTAPAQVAEGILAYLRSKGFASPSDLRGRLRLHHGTEGAETP
jgi:dihydroorotate dehydrogenase (NAD+) catalytic subunit